MPGVSEGPAGAAAGELDIARERDWDLLLDEIEEGDVVPIIGQDVLSQKRDGHTTDANVDFAQHLAEGLGLTLSDEGQPSVSGVASAFVEQGGRISEVYETMEWLVRRAAKEPYPTSLGELAEITPFRLFVTTNFDHWMEQALTEAGRSAVSLAYEPSEQGSDLPKDFEHRKEAFVYHLLGRPGVGSFAVTEEDILEFMHRLLSPASARRPDQLFDILEKSHLLFLGCRFPDWLTRFFLRMARGVPLGDPHGRKIWIAGGTVDGKAGAGLKQFLTTSTQRTRIFRTENASQFVAELHTRWTERYPDGMEEEEVAPEPEAREKVFLSYASEDRDRLRAICEKLDEKNVLYWFDRDELRGGDDWNEKIRRNVASCSLFVPFISKQAQTKKDRYFFYEWSEALERQKRFPANGTFMLPVQLDQEVDPYSEELKVDLSHINWMQPEEFLEHIVDLYREKQRDLLDGRVAE